MQDSRESSETRPEPAGWGRRVLALVIDWFVALLSVSVVTGQPLLGASDADPWAPLFTFWVEVTLLTGLLGFTIGKRVAGVRVIGPHGRPIGLARSALRTLLLCLVVPPLIRAADGRGLHDVAAGSMVTERRRS